ncbi:hypothetical protein [Streptomyces sp. NPDC016626]|uniref:hypothetical protein n=1 Tax=Streptomyces sp. NPDC016626 TaxID=3364968 RepID=UPI0037032F22
MTDHRLEGPGENGAGIPRDLPDQQAGADEDPWEVAPAAAERESKDGEDGAHGPEERTVPAGSGERAEPAGPDDSAEAGGSGPDVPDTDEAGTGRQGAPHSASGTPGQPVPDEPSG